MIKRPLKKKVYGKRCKLVVRSPLHLYHVENLVLACKERRCWNKALINGEIEKYYDNVRSIMRTNDFSEPLTQYTMALIEHIVANTDDRIEYEGASLMVYSNNTETIEKLAHHLYFVINKDYEGCQNDNLYENSVKRNHPGTDVVLYLAPDILEDGTVILTSRMKDCSYKIYLNKTITSGFGKWLIANKDQLHIPSGLQHKIEKQLNVERKTIATKHNFFYVKNENMLLLVKMSFVTEINKIYKVLISDKKSETCPTPIIPSRVF